MKAFFFILSIVLGSTAQTAESAVVWDIGAAGLFDESNHAYPIDHGRVDVDLQSPTDKFPTGLGHLASGRESVRVIALRFAAQRAGEYWLHVIWEPGGSGVEQFAIRANDKRVGTSRQVDAAESPNAEQREQFAVNCGAGVNTIALEFRSGDGLRFRQITLTTGKELPHIAKLKPGMEFVTQEAFASAIGEPAIMLDGVNVRLLAPQRRAKAARIVFGYLEKAYSELYAIVGIHTKYKIVIYAFPEGNSNITGGTSECEIRYSDKNLDPATFESVRTQPVPHVAGFIEEMAHNFVDAAHVQFGWEMVGWSLGVKVTTRLANTPAYARSLRETRRGQIETFQGYIKEGYALPKSVPANLCDRVHAHLLWMCEQKYGADFWRDFFEQVRASQAAYRATASISGDDECRNARYRLTVQCFDRLKGLEFKQVLERYHISRTVDVKSLHPTDEKWNRRLE